MIEPKKIYYNPNRTQFFQAGERISLHSLYFGREHAINAIKNEIAYKIAEKMVDNIQWEIRQDATCDIAEAIVIGTCIMNVLSFDEKSQQDEYLEKRTAELSEKYEKIYTKSKIGY